jgi:hypothetical protein
VLSVREKTTRQKRGSKGYGGGGGLGQGEKRGTGWAAGEGKERGQEGSWAWLEVRILFLKPFLLIFETVLNLKTNQKPNFI